MADLPSRREIEEWREDDYIAANERLRARIAELEAEVGEWQRQAGKYAEDAANLQRGLAVYRQDGHWHVEDAHGADADLSGYGPCGVCAWERKQREESDNETEPPRNLPDPARRRRLNPIQHSCYNDDRQHI